MLGWDLGVLTVLPLCWGSTGLLLWRGREGAGSFLPLSLCLFIAGAPQGSTAGAPETEEAGSPQLTDEQAVLETARSLWGCSSQAEPPAG